MTGGGAASFEGPPRHYGEWIPVQRWPWRSRPKFVRHELRESHPKYAGGMRWMLVVQCFCARTASGYFMEERYADEYEFQARLNPCKWVHPGSKPFQPEDRRSKYRRAVPRPPAAPAGSWLPDVD